MYKLLTAITCGLVLLLPWNVQAYVYNPANGHYYGYIGGAIEWYNAQAAAERQTYLGNQGYLATIASADEMTFVNQNFENSAGAWIGGYQVPGNTTSSSARWVTGESWSYSAWGATYPNTADEWANGLYLNPAGGWADDLMGRGRQGYIIEFGDWQSAPVLNPLNGNYYQAISIPSGINWFNAKTACENMSWAGVNGHLVSITSADENSFVSSLVPVASGYWIGGYQPVGSAEPEGGWCWATGEQWDYANWDTYEPNNSLGDDHTDLRLNGKWNDRNGYDASPSGYIVEFEAVPEPSCLLCISSGLGIMCGLLRRRR